MISPYWMTILPISYIFVRSIGETIEKEAKRKLDLIRVNTLYNQHLECLSQKGFTHYTKIEDLNLRINNNYDAIVQNKDIKELEVCKNTYLNFIMVYRKYKNNIF